MDSPKTFKLYPPTRDSYIVVSKQTKRILIIDDDFEFVVSLQKILSKSGYIVHSAGSCKDAYGRLSEESYFLIFLDLYLPDKSGLDFLKDIKAKSPETKVIMITVNGDIYNYDKAMEEGAFAYLNKPVKRNKILTYTSRALSQFKNQFIH